MRYHADLQWVRMAFRDFSRTVVRFRVKLPHLAENPPAGFGGGRGIHLVFDGITIVNTNPNNNMTAISTGNRSPVTMKNGGIVGFRDGIKTGNDSPVDLTDAPIIAPTPTVPTDSNSSEKPESTPQ